MILQMLHVKRLTCVVAVDVDVLGCERKFEGILDNILIKLIVEEGVTVFLPGYCLQGQNVLIVTLFNCCACHYLQ